MGKKKSLDSGSISEASAHSSCLMRFVRVPVEIKSAHQKVAEPNLSLCMNWILSWFFLERERKRAPKMHTDTVNGKLIHFILQRKRFGKGCKCRFRKQRNLSTDNLNRIPERLDNLSFTWNNEKETNLMPLRALLVYWSSTHVLSKWSNDMQKRPVGHTFTCGGVTTVCGRSAEQKQRIKIHGIIKFTVRPTWNWSTRRKKSSSSPAIGIYSIYTPTETMWREKRKEKREIVHPVREPVFALWLCESQSGKMNG